jgi:tRNA-binding protein
MLPPPVRRSIDVPPSGASSPASRDQRQGKGIHFAAPYLRALGEIVIDQIVFDDFLKVDIRVGTILAAEVFPQARKPAYRLTIDFGADIGIKKSSAQITRHYTTEGLVGKQVVAVVNFPPRQIGPFMSEVLTLGVPDADGEVVLLHPSIAVPNGGRMF